MRRELIMLVLALGTAGAMVATLTVFFRRLRRIEEEKWGKAAQGPRFRARLAALLKRRPRSSGGGGPSG